MATLQQRQDLIARLERQARETPAQYRFKVALLAALGFVVLGASVVLALGLSIGMVVLLVAISPVLLVKLIKVIWIPIALGWVMLRSLWIRFTPPEGYRLGPHEAPALQAEVERLRVAVGGPPLAGIIIDDRMNAAAASVPRMLGLLGHRHYLVLGLPLMQSMGPEQFASVIAHEFGHFGAGHGRFSGWIYHVRVSWYRLLEELQQRRSRASRPFTRFFEWYAPFFNDYSFVLARHQEYEADRAAARATGPHVAAEALVRVRIGAERLEQDFWPHVQHAVRTRPEPPALLFREMGESLRLAGDSDAARLAVALEQQPGYHDTHPTLAQRLAALGMTPAVVAPPRTSFAEKFLDDLLAHLELRFSEQWRDNVHANWEQGYRQHQEDVQRFAALEGNPTRTAEESVEHARLSEILHPERDPLPLYREVLERVPQDAFLHYRIGSLLLARKDPSGASLLWSAMDIDPDFTEAALANLGEYYHGTADADGQQRVTDRWHDLQSQRVRAHEERSEIQSSDQFLPHDLDEAALDAVREAVARTGQVRRAWLARKCLSQPAGPPHFVLLVSWRGMVWREQSALQRLADTVEVPGSLVVITASNRRMLARRLRKAAGNPVYRRRWWQRSD